MICSVILGAIAGSARRRLLTTLKNRDSTRPSPRSSIRKRGLEGRSMRYERHDTRAYAIKIVSILLASAVTAGVPTWIVARAMGF